MIKQKLKAIYARFYAMEIFMFHSVGDINKHQTCFNTDANFRRIITDNKSRVIHIREFDKLSWRNKNKKVIITFDDGWDDFYVTSFPILRELNMPFILFVSTSNLDKEGYITRQQLLEISKYSGSTIGSHCVNHKNLAELPKPEVEKELVESKKKIESIVGKSCEYIAYPYGGNSRMVRCLARKYYRLGFAVCGQKATWITCLGKMRIPRIDMSDRR